jgi:hypothetical protein
MRSSSGPLIRFWPRAPLAKVEEDGPLMLPEAWEGLLEEGTA